MPAHPLISHAQWEVLLQHMKAHPDMAMGCTNSESPLDKRKIAEDWKKLSCKLNSLGSGQSKTPDKWRDYWNQAKYAARKKACARRQQASGMASDRNFKKLVELTHREESILALITKAVVHDGEASVRIPFEDDDQVSVASDPAEPEPPQDDTPWKPVVKDPSPRFESASATHKPPTSQQRVLPTIKIRHDPLKLTKPRNHQAFKILRTASQPEDYEECNIFGKLVAKKLSRFTVNHRDLLMIKINTLIYEESIKAEYEHEERPNASSSTKTPDVVCVESRNHDRPRSSSSNSETDYRIQI